MSLETDPFDWRVTKDGQVLVTRRGRTVTVVRGGTGAQLAAQLEAATPEQAQQLLARVTGNYKRGNEKRGTRP